MCAAVLSAFAAACGGERSDPAPSAYATAAAPIVADAQPVAPAPAPASASRRWPLPCRITRRDPGQKDQITDLVHDRDGRLTSEHETTLAGPERTIFSYDGARLRERDEIIGNTGALYVYRYDTGGHLVEQALQEMYLDTSASEPADLQLAAIESAIAHARAHADTRTTRRAGSRPSGTPTAHASATRTIRADA